MQTFWEIGKTYTFESSHRVGCQTLPPFKCKNSIHGHSYQLTVSITGTKLFNNFILDYGEIDEFMKPEIDKIDHSFMYGNKEKDEDYVKLMKDKGWRLYHINEDYVTAENISKYFAEFLYNKLLDILSEEQLKTIIKISVETKETNKTYARYTINL